MQMGSACILKVFSYISFWSLSSYLCFVGYSMSVFVANMDCLWIDYNVVQVFTRMHKRCSEQDLKKKEKQTNTAL